MLLQATFQTRKLHTNCLVAHTYYIHTIYIDNIHIVHATEPLFVIWMNWIVAKFIRCRQCHKGSYVNLAEICPLLHPPLGLCCLLKHSCPSVLFLLLFYFFFCDNFRLICSKQPPIFVFIQYPLLWWRVFSNLHKQYI